MWKTTNIVIESYEKASDAIQSYEKGSNVIWGGIYPSFKYVKPKEETQK